MLGIVTGIALNVIIKLKIKGEINARVKPPNKIYRLLFASNNPIIKTTVKPIAEGIPVRGTCIFLSISMPPYMKRVCISTKITTPMKKYSKTFLSFFELFMLLFFIGFLLKN